MSITTTIKFRGLSTTDKKQISILRSAIDELGKEIAVRSNNLDVLFTTIRNLLKDMPSSEADDMYSITASDVLSLQNLVNAQEKAFRDDALGIYHYELDEDLIVPIAHACLALWNKVEGYDTAPYVPPTDDVREKKKARVELAKTKKEQAAEKQREEKLEKAQQKEAERLKREELRKSIASPFMETETVEDETIQNPRALGFVDYSSIPFQDAKEFSRALEIWTFLVSIPQVLTLSQFSLSMFISSIEDDSETFLIQEICRMLVRVGAKGSPLVKMAVKTQGRNWFDQVREYLAVASGAKQQRKEEMERKKKKMAEKTEECDEGEKDAAALDSASGSDDEEEAAHHENEEDEDVDFATDFADMMKAMEEMKGRVGWANLEIHDRLVLLKFLVDSILQAPAVLNDVENVVAGDKVEQATFERAVKEAKDECEKELKAAARRKIEGGETIADTREAIISKMKASVDAAFAIQMEGVEKKDAGARIMPLGEDRYGRLYWRFPLDHNIYVQTLATTKSFPLVEKTKVTLMDDDDDDNPTPLPVQPSSTESKGPSQKVWGKIVPADLDPFINSLESRGRKESQLRVELERLVSHVTSLAIPANTVRITRSRAINKGYTNRLNVPAMLPY